MNSPGDKPSRESPRTADSGRSTHDDRGDSVCESQLETGVYSRDIHTGRLKKLDLNDLSIAESGSYPSPFGGGFNPYDNSSTAGGNVDGDSYNGAGRGALKPGASGAKGPPRRKPVDPEKLEEWLALRKRVEHNEREDGDD